MRAFVARDLFVETRVFDGDGEMRGEDRKHLHVIRREVIQLRAFEVHHAHNARLVDHGHGQLRAGLGIDHAVAGIERHVGDHDGPREVTLRRRRCLRARERRIFPARAGRTSR